MNKKKIFVIISTIYSILFFIYCINKVELINTMQPYDYGTVMLQESGFILSIPLIIFLVKYICAIKKSEEFFDLKSITNVALLLNITVLIINIVDVVYYLIISKHILGVYTASFFLLAFIPLEIVYLILIIWLNILGKEKVKRTILDRFKIANVVLSLILMFILMLNDDFAIWCLIIPMILMLFQFMQLLIKNKNVILKKTYNIFLVIINILLIAALFSIYIYDELLFVFIFVIINIFAIILIYQFVKKNKLLKILFKIIVSLIIIGIAYLLINNFVIKPIKIKQEEKQLYIKYKRGNKYSKKNNYEYVKLNYNLTIENKEDINSFFYTFMNSGIDDINIKCSKNYKDCQKDFEKNTKDAQLLTIISGYVSPYNSFSEINSTFADSKNINIIKSNIYNDKQIKKINKKINEVYKKNFDKNKTKEENIKIFHDYIADNCIYTNDVNINDAYQLLYNGKSASAGYSDVMALFLDKMDIKNIRIYSDNHVWNLVYIDGKWKHIDVSWDDPVMSDGTDTILYDYFLIDTDKLKSYNDDSHNYDELIYMELK